MKISNQTFCSFLRIYFSPFYDNFFAIIFWWYKREANFQLAYKIEY